MRLIRDGEIIYLSLHCQDDHLDFHTAPELSEVRFEQLQYIPITIKRREKDDLKREYMYAIKKNKNMLLLKCCFTSTETVRLLGTGAQDVHLDFHTAPEF